LKLIWAENEALSKKKILFIEYCMSGIEGLVGWVVRGIGSWGMFGYHEKSHPQLLYLHSFTPPSSIGDPFFLNSLLKHTLKMCYIITIRWIFVFTKNSFRRISIFTKNLFHRINDSSKYIANLTWPNLTSARMLT